MRTIFISLAMIASLAACSQPKVSEQQAQYAAEVRGKLDHCSENFQTCDGYIIEYANGRLDRLAIIRNTSEFNVVDRAAFEYRVVAGADRWFTSIRHVYTPDDPGFKDAFFRYHCRSSVACARAYPG
jgi:hypothetical protein